MQQTVQPIADTGAVRRSGSARSVGRALARLVTLPFHAFGFAFHWAVRIVEYGIFAALLALVALGGYLYWAASTQPMQIDPATTGYLPPEGMTLKEFLGYEGQEPCFRRDVVFTVAFSALVEAPRILSVRLNPNNPAGFQPLAFLFGEDVNPLPPHEMIMGPPLSFAGALRWEAENGAWRFLTSGGGEEGASCKAPALPPGSTRATTAAK